MSDNLTSYGWYITNDNGTRYLCITSNDGGNYEGAATVFYSKLDDTDTTSDTNAPTIEARHHMALVFGALMMMGYSNYAKSYDKYVRDARATAGGFSGGVVKLYDY